MSEVPRRVLRAVVYVCGAGQRREADCLALVERNSYTLVALVRDETGARFAEVMGMAQRGDLDVIVTPSIAMLPPDRIPRIETLDERPADRARPAAPVLTRRPRPLD